MITVRRNKDMKQEDDGGNDETSQSGQRQTECRLLLQETLRLLLSCKHEPSTTLRRLQKVSPGTLITYSDFEL